MGKDAVIVGNQALIRRLTSSPARFHLGLPGARDFVGRNSVWGSGYLEPQMCN